MKPHHFLNCLVFLFVMVTCAWYFERTQRPKDLFERRFNCTMTNNATHCARVIVRN